MWKSFLLRPYPEARDPAEFREYTKKWMRPAADDDAGTFRIWETTAGPPSHSVPAHLVAKAAAELGPEAFDAIHERLLHGYFAENRDISDPGTLHAIWAEAGLPGSDFARVSERRLLDAVIADHREAVELGLNGVPAARMDGNDAATVGAQPLAVYRRWIEKSLALTR